MTKTYRAGRFTIIVEDEETSILDIPEIDEEAEEAAAKKRRRKAKPLSFMPPRKRGRPRGKK